MSAARSPSRRLPHLPWLAGGGMLALALAAWWLPRFRPGEGAASGPEPVLRSELVLREGRLYRRGEPRPFTGVMIERYSDGALKSRSAVRAGRLDGLSEGWYPDGQRQIEEHFVAGVSAGRRVKWYPNGRKRSEATIARGRIQGTFRRWHENGALAEEVEMRDGQPDGLAKSYYPSGFLKVRARVRGGRVEERQTWPDGKKKG